MKIQIKNIRGIADCDIEIDQIGLVAAPNGGGKSSLAQAVAAALTQHPMPIDVLDKKDAGKLLRTGTKRGFVTVSDDGRGVTVNYPGGSVTTTCDDPPSASRYAAGLVSVFDLDPKKAAAALMDSIKAEPTLEDLQAGADELGVGSVAVPLWEKINSAVGRWDLAFKEAKEKGARIKGQWEEVTKENYGSQKADGWRHASLPEGAAPTVEQVDDGLNKLTIALETARAGLAADSILISDLQKKSAGLDELKKSMESSAAEISAQNTIAENLARKLQELPQPVSTDYGTPCPHCAALVVIDGDSLRVPGEDNSSLNIERNSAITAVNRGLVEAKQRLQALVNARNNTHIEMRMAEGAAERLSTLNTEATSTPDEVQTLLDRIARGNALKAAVTATSRAAELAFAITQNAAIQKLLAPTGVRQTVLKTKLDKLNARLAELCAAASWPVVSIGDDLQILCGDVERALMCESEKFRVRTVLKMVTAHIDGSTLAIIDAADILDKRGRNGLFAMLRFAGIPALVCMTLNSVDEVPKLAAAGVGKSFWIGDGLVVEAGK